MFRVARLGVNNVFCSTKEKNNRRNKINSDFVNLIMNLYNGAVSNLEMGKFHSDKM